MPIHVDPIVPDPNRASFDESLAMAKSLDAQVKECYFNSIIGVCCWTRGIPEDKKFYVEGVALDQFGIPMEHGWIKVEDKIIDPTWSLIYDEKRMASVVYIPAILYSMEELHGLLAKSFKHRDSMKLPLFLYPDLSRTPYYDNEQITKAYEAALRHSLGDSAVEFLRESLRVGRLEIIS